ncbi:MAG: hypothetical protein WDZ59_07510 [Pirellulales bacterium]
MKKTNRSTQLMPADNFVPGPYHPSPINQTQEAPAPGVSLVGMLRRHWHTLLVCGAISAAAAYYVGENHATNSWNFSGTLLYNRSTSGAPHYVPPDLQTVATMVTARETVDELRDEFALDAPPQEIVSAVHTHTPMGSSTLEVTLSWPHEVQGQEMLKRLMELFVDHVVHTRNEAIEKYIEEYRQGLVRSREALTAATTAYLDFSREHGIVDVARDLERLQDDTSTLELNLELAKVRRDNCVAQLNELVSMQEGLAQEIEAVEPVATNSGNGSDSGSGGSSSPSGSAQSREGAQPGGNIAAAHRLQSAVDLQKRIYLQEKIRREEDRVEADARLKMARSEYDRAKQLREKQYISQAEFDRVAAELQILEAKRGEQIQEWNDELNQIERRMPSILREQALTSPVPSRLGRSVAEIELERIASEGEIQQFQTTIATKQGEVERLREIRQRADELSADVEVATNERQRLETLLATFDQLKHSNMHEFSVIQPASPALNPVRSNKTKLALGTFLMVSMVLSAPLLAAELYRNRERPAEGAARRLGLPVLAKRYPGRHSAISVHSARNNEFPRLLALRIQQAMNKPGSVLLFSSLNDRPASISLIASSANCFAQRGERVLLIDVGTTPQNRRELEALIDDTHEPLETNGHCLSDMSRGGNIIDEPVSPVRVADVRTVRDGHTPGVADFIVSGDCDLDEMIRPTQMPGVDCITPGTVAMPEEGLGTRRMTELLERLRTRYTMILVAGPTTAQPVDLAMLAARTEGIVFSTEGSRSANARGEQVVRDLIDLDAPILGFVE